MSQLFVRLLLDVILHFVRDETIRDLIANSRHKANVIRVEVLRLALIGNFNAANGVVAQLDGTDEHIARHTVELLVYLKVVTELIFVLLVLTVRDVHGLTSVEDGRQNVGLLAVERNGFTETARDYFAIQLVLDSIVQED